MSDLEVAAGLTWLFEWINGKSFRQLERETGRDRRTVKKYAERAATKLVDDAKVSLHEELFPLVRTLLKLHMTNEIKKAKEGKDVNFTQLNKFMTGMNIYGEPSKETSSTSGVEVEDDGDYIEEVRLRLKASKRVNKELAEVSENIIDVEKEKDEV